MLDLSEIRGQVEHERFDQLIDSLVDSRSPVG
jgi:hypothetical protein